MDTNELLLSIKLDISELKKTITSLTPKNPMMEIWIPRTEIMKWLNYGPTQMAAFEKNKDLIVTKVGKRKFINKASLEKLLEKNILRGKEIY
ncbi:MAG TPA: hypothetical protein VHD35_11250 [Chitinophagaceae bacterium]|nr:hypothetical protein [Chitinophagaceae bacterium]